MCRCIPCTYMQGERGWKWETVLVLRGAAISGVDVVA